MIDCGASDCFISGDFVAAHCLNILTSSLPFSVKLADGSVHSSSSTCSLRLHLGTYTAAIRFIVVPLAASQQHDVSIILGMTWLQHVNPFLDWRSRRLQFRHGGQLHTIAPAMPLTAAQPRVACAASAPELRLANARASSTPFSCYSIQLTPAQRIARDYADRVCEEIKELPPLRSINCRIQLKPHDRAPCTAPYKLNPIEQAELKKQLTSLLARGFIRPSTSPYAAGCTFEDRNNKLRLCFDYRRLNDLTVMTKYTTPDVTTLLDQLGKAKVFTKLDLASGFHQVRVEEDCIPYTAFATRYGNFEWLCMPFGLCDAPATLMRLLQTIFFKELDDFLVIYVDDLLIYSNSEEEHERHLRIVMQRLRDHQLFVRGSKCEFFSTDLQYLGYRITPGSLHTLHSRTAAIKQWPRPANVHDVRVFLGLCNFYRRFVRGFGDIAAPLNWLTKPEVAFVWTNEQQSAFDELRCRLTSAPVLALPDMDKPFTVETDASDIALAATLLQEDRVVAYLSRKFKDVETRYTTYEKEVLAMIEALTVWRHFLVRQPFVVITDNKALSFLKTQPLINRRQSGWLEKLSTLQFKLVHKPGNTNRSDPLTRRPDYAKHVQLAAVGQSQTSALQYQDLLEAIREAYEADDRCCRLLEDAQERFDKGITLRHGLLVTADDRVYVPEDWDIKVGLMLEGHSSAIAGHCGAEKTADLIARSFYWPKLGPEVRDFVRKCDKCQRNKALTQPAAGLLQPHKVPEYAWETITLDFITELPRTRCGQDALLVVVDKLTKMTHLIPCTTRLSAPDTARLIFENIVRLHGVPRLVISDRDVRFTSRFWRELFALLGTQLNFSSAHHPQTDGQTERQNRTIEQMLRAMTSQFEEQWIDHLTAVEIAINNSKQSSSLFTPFFLNYGRHPHLLFNTTVHDCRNEAAVRTVKSMQDTIAIARGHLEIAAARQKRFADQHRSERVFKVGDQVLLSTKHLRLRDRRSKKTSPLWIGPFAVERVVAPGVYRLELPNTMGIHPVFNVDKLKAYHAHENEDEEMHQAAAEPAAGDSASEADAEDNSDALRRRVSPARRAAPPQSPLSGPASPDLPPVRSAALPESPVSGPESAPLPCAVREQIPPVVLSDEQPRQVQCIVGRRSRKRGGVQVTQFLVKWRGLSAHENSWEDEASLGHATQQLDEWLDQQDSAVD